MGKQSIQWQTIFLGSKITADGDCSHKIKRLWLLGRKVMTNLDCLLKRRDIIWPTKVHLVKAMVFPVVMYTCESWAISKAEHQRIDSIESVMPPSHLVSCHSLLLMPSVFPSIGSFQNNESVLHIRWPKYWSFSFSINPSSNEYSGFISFRIDWFDFLAIQGILKSLL